MMTVIKDFVCLANSRKAGGRCIAGIEVVAGQPVRWIRPISHRPNAAVWEQERQFHDHSEPRPLDLCRIQVRSSKPEAHQSENWLLDPSTRWRRLGRWTWFDLSMLMSAPNPLWLTGDPSTQHGKHDRVEAGRCGSLLDSLRLICVPRLGIRVFTAMTDSQIPTRRVQGTFTYLGEEYRLRITDPEIERIYQSRNNGDYAMGECYVTISLGAQHRGYCYKLIAAVITRTRVEHAK